MTGETAEREALAERILTDARERAALLPHRYLGVQKNILVAAGRQARKVLSGELRDWEPTPRKSRKPSKPTGVAKPAPPKTRVAPVPRDLRAARDDPAAEPARSRACLCCRRSFESAGPDNRLCTTCRGRSSDLSPYAI